MSARRASPIRDTQNSGQKALPHKGLLENIHPLKRLGINDVLEAEILARLDARSAAATDLAQQIFRDSNGQAPSRAQYMRVLRTLQRLERKGYVVRSPFGKEKPYRLTKYGHESIAAVSRGLEPSPIVSVRDIAWCVVALLATAASLVVTSIEPPSALLMVLWLMTGLISGSCAMRLTSIIGRIW